MCIRDSDISGQWLYLAGSFRTVARNGNPQNASSAVRVRHTDGVIDSGWKPNVQGGSVQGIAAGSTTSRVFLAGFFTSVNGYAPAAWGAVLNGINGAPIAGQHHVSNTTDDDKYQLAVETANGHVYFGGAQHGLQVYRESDMMLRRSYLTNFAGGDIQVIEAVGNRVYVGCHCWDEVFSSVALQTFPWPNPFSSRTDVRGIFAVNATTLSRVNTFDPVLSGRSGVWAIHANPSDGCLWVGGDITTSGGRPTTRMPRLCGANGAGPAAGPQLKPPAPVTCSARVVDSGAVFLRWSKLPNVTAWVIYRNGHFLRRITNPNQLSAFDVNAPAGVHRYTVQTLSGGNLSNPRGCNPRVTVASQALPVAACRVFQTANGRWVNYDRAANDGGNSVVVERSRNGGGFFWAARRPNAAIGWADGNIAAGNNYSYRVKVSGPGGDSTYRTCSPT